MEGVDPQGQRARILFSGASGMLGGALREALGRRSEVWQLVRRTPASAREIFWNPSSSRPIGLPDTLEGMSAAIHLSGANVAGQRWTSRYKREMYASRVGSTRALAAMLAGLRRPPQVLLVASATGIYGDRGDETLSEDSSPGSGYLADLCREWEVASAPASTAGIRVVHLRFGVVLGEGAGALAKMLPVFRLGLGGRLGSGRQWMSWIALQDGVRAVEFVLQESAMSGAVNVVSPQPVTNAEFTRALAQRVHRPALFPVPALGLRLIFGEMAQETMLSSTRVRPARLLAAGFQFSQPRVEDALRTALL